MSCAILTTQEESHQVSITGAQGTTTGNTACSVLFLIKAVTDAQPSLTLIAAIVPKVTCDLPLQGAVGVKDHPHIKDLALADAHFDRPGRIDLLIGCNLLPNILTSDIRQRSAEQPTAMKTIFGWAIMGIYRPIVEGASQNTTSVCNGLPMSESDALLRKFWETKEVSISSPCHTPEEKQVLKHFEANHTFLPTGRYQVMLPRKPDAPLLGESRKQTVKRFLSNENATIRKGTWTQFQAVVDEYIQLGHA